jgi:glutathione S-transferase
MLLLLSTMLLVVASGLSLAAPSVKKVTLYRDSNGWCPFCEKVWVALREKEIPFEEVLIDLKDKPEWYVSMVPTTLVPAIELHDLNYDALTPGSGALTYDSAAVLKVLDEEFPDSRALLVEAEKGEKKTASATLTTAMFEVCY